MSSQSITLAFRKHGHIFSVVFPWKQGLETLSDPTFIDNLEDMLANWNNPTQQDAFGPLDAGLILFDVDRKYIYAFQEEQLFDWILLEKGWTDVNTKRFERLWQDGRIRSTSFNYKNHPLTQEATFDVFQKKLEQLFREGNVETNYALAFQIDPPPGWTWKSFDGGMDAGLDLDSGLVLFKQLVKEGFTFKDQDYKRWDDFFFPYTLSSRSVHAQMDREEIELETVSASPLRKMPRL